MYLFFFFIMVINRANALRNSVYHLLRLCEISVSLVSIKINRKNTNKPGHIVDGKSLSVTFVIQLLILDQQLTQ